MIKFLWRFFVTGFPGKPKCEHDFSKWEVYKVSRDDYNMNKLIWQHRQCKKCGYTDFSKEYK